MMKREERAKQFAPFDALTGLHKALAQKELEHDRIEKIEVSESRADELERAIKKLERGMRVRITYYSNGFYATVEGSVTAVDTVYGYIKVGEGKIFFDDLYEIKFL